PELQEELAAAAAGGEIGAVAAHDGERHEATAAGAGQIADETAFGAERQPVGGVLDVGAHHEATVVGVGGSADADPRVGRVGGVGHGAGGRPEGLPVDGAGVGGHALRLQILPSA